MKRIILAVLTVALTGITAPAFGGPKACDSLGGTIVFKDTLYGIGIGGLIGGLGVAASGGDSDNAGQIVAGGALLGALFGVGFGAYEVSSRECGEPKPDFYQKNEHHYKSGAYLREGLTPTTLDLNGKPYQSPEALPTISFTWAL
ncbi:MAG: hypothetical protein HRU19_13480 [Pseudobacteriovorax sp.]|nr:hypothetical protein [Pseudobacteriovorax sp.]